MVDSQTTRSQNGSFRRKWNFSLFGKKARNFCVFFRGEFWGRNKEEGECLVYLVLEIIIKNFSRKKISNEKSRNFSWMSKEWQTKAGSVSISGKGSQQTHLLKELQSIPRDKNWTFMMLRKNQKQKKLKSNQNYQGWGMQCLLFRRISPV